jgi:predicted  nucleic acid-binding Zn-ribbon protein
MSAAELYALQEVDSAVDACERELEQVRAHLDEGAEVAAARAEVARLETELAAAQRRLRELETAATDLRAKMTPIEQRLYSGAVRHPKELQGLQDELTMYRRQLDRVEDDELAAMEALEGATAALAAARERLVALETAWQEEQARLRQREQELLAQRDRLQAQRQARAGRVTPTLLALYERLRPLKRGQAVARIERGVCAGCRITLPTTVQQRARAGTQVLQCPSCERILYAG